jgi:Spy/CpxP family protein refolding chaperone
MKKLIGGAAAVLALALGFVALTGFGGGGCGHRGGPGRDPAQMAAFVNGRVDDLLDDVDATPDQRTKIHAVADRMLAEAQALHKDRGQVHDTVLAEWKAETPDKARLHALVDARADELRKLAHDAVDAGVEIHDVLTPAQREKLAKKAERWHR